MAWVPGALSTSHRQPSAPNQRGITDQQTHLGLSRQSVQTLTPTQHRTTHTETVGGLTRTTQLDRDVATGNLTGLTDAEGNVTSLSYALGYPVGSVTIAGDSYDIAATIQVVLDAVTAAVDAVLHAPSGRRGPALYH